MIPRRGFRVGKYEELCEQAFWGGVRLPGYHSVKQGKMDLETSKFPSTEHGLEKFLAVGDRVRISSRIYCVDKDADDPTAGIIPIDRVWRHKEKSAVVVYRYPPLTKYEAMVRKAGYAVIESQLTQMILRAAIRGGDFLEQFLVLANRLVKARLGMKAAARLKAFTDGFKARKKRLGYFDSTKQNRLLGDDDEAAKALASLPDLEAEKEAKRKAAYLDAENTWEERVDEKTLKQIWVHKETGEIRDIKPDDAEEAEEKNRQMREFAQSQKMVAKMRKGGRKELGKKRK